MWETQRRARGFRFPPGGGILVFAFLLQRKAPMSLKRFSLNFALRCFVPDGTALCTHICIPQRAGGGGGWLGMPAV